MDESGQARSFPVHWRVILQTGTAPQQVRHRGHTYDISVRGCSLLLRDNVAAGQRAELLLAVPPLDDRHEGQVLSFACKIEHALFMSKQQCFQVRLHFLAEAREACQALDRALSARYGPLA